MSTSTTQAEQYLLDRQEILDCIYLYCRAIDRHDRELMATVFYPDAIVNFGAWEGLAPAFFEWCTSLFTEQNQSHSHNITSHNCDVDGNIAHTESYVIQSCLRKDGKTVIVSGGRYVDRLEKRNGTWRIAHRRMVVDWQYSADGAESHSPDGYLRGTRDKSDTSYMRPLKLSPELMEKLDGKGT